jgi:hypothetical protein
MARPATNAHHRWERGLIGFRKTAQALLHGDFFKQPVSDCQSASVDGGNLQAEAVAETSQPFLK